MKGFRPTFMGELPCARWVRSGSLSQSIVARINGWSDG